MRDDDETGMGLKFFLGLAGVTLLVGVGLFIVVILAFKALYAWGILGFFAFLALVIFGGGWLVDKRREAERRI